MAHEIEDLAFKAAKHIARATGLEASVGSRVECGGLPRFLSNGYSFLTIMIDGQRCVVFSPRSDNARALTVSKHTKTLIKYFGSPVIYLLPEVTRPGLQRLIEASVPFVVPGSHVHLPGQVVEIGNRFTNIIDDLMRPRLPGKLGPTAQAMLVRRILRLDVGRVPSMGLAAALQVNPVTSLAAANELIQAKLAVHGRSKQAGSIEFVAHGRELFERALPLMQSPLILRQHYRCFEPPKWLHVGGETALSQLTNLGQPRVPVFVASRRQRRGVSMVSGLERCLEADADVTVEVWGYSPYAISRQAELVDPLSLHLQFREHPDERVAMAAAALMGIIFA
jgi:hypothetical protein